MATWDSADLLQRVQDITLRPTTDEQLTSAVIYRFLTASQRNWFEVFAVHCPHVLYGAPTAMSTSDSGVTYTFSGSITPLAVQIFTTWPNGQLLVPCSAWVSGDYIWEGSRIRMPAYSTSSFPTGVPYARYITPPGVIDGSTAPTLLPDHAREILVYDAAAMWARSGVLRDPRFFEAERDRLAWGDGVRNPGIIGALKLQNPFMGETAFPGVGAVTTKQYLAEITNYHAI